MPCWLELWSGKGNWVTAFLVLAFQVKLVKKTSDFCLCFQALLDLGTDAFGYGFGGTGKKSNNKNFESYGESFGFNDTIGCYLDLDSGEVAFSKNGKYLGQAFKLSDSARSRAFYPAVVLKVLICLQYETSLFTFFIFL